MVEQQQKKGDFRHFSWMESGKQMAQRDLVGVVFLMRRQLKASLISDETFCFVSTTKLMRERTLIALEAVTEQEKINNKEPFN